MIVKTEPLTRILTVSEPVMLMDGECCRGTIPWGMCTREQKEGARSVWLDASSYWVAVDAENDRRAEATRFLTRVMQGETQPTADQMEAARLFMLEGKP